jgi:predicted transcriptional regulator
MSSATITVRLEHEVKDRLARLANSTRRSKSFLASEAIREFLENNEWQIAETRAALKEADEIDFASAREVNRVQRKWKLDADSVAAQSAAQP